MIGGLKPYPDYKQSKTPWLKKIPADWDSRRLRHLCEMRVSNVDKHTKRGETPVRLCNYVHVYKNERIRESIPFMSASATEDERIRFRLRKFDVVITKDSEDWNDIGVPSLVEFEAPDLVCGYHLAILRPRAAIIGAFLHRALQCHFIAAQFHVEANGITRYGLSQGAIRGISIPVPPHADQLAIVRFLDHANGQIDRAIRAKKKLIALLNEQRQVLIQNSVTRGIDPAAGRALKPVPEVLSRIPWLASIPESWKFVSSRMLFSPRKDFAQPGDIQLSATQAFGVIPQADFEQRVGRRVVKVSMHLDKRRHVQKDDFVISMRSFQGGLERAWSTGCIRSSYVVLKPNVEVDTGYFSYLFKCQTYIQALQRTSNFIRDGQDLNYGNFCQVALPQPQLEEQREIAAYLDRSTMGLSAAINQAVKEIDLLREYKACLTTNVITGVADIRQEAERLPADPEEANGVKDVESLDEGELLEEDSVA